MRKFSVVVVGGGPAGSTAAYRLADAGLSVLLLEKARMPLVKPCGGALTHRALSLLPREVVPYIQSHPDRWTLSHPNHTPVTVATPEPYCHVVDRPTFDYALVEVASRRGALIHDGEALVNMAATPAGYLLTTTHSQYEAAYVVAADGAHSTVARLTKFPLPRLGAAVEGEFLADAHEWELYANRVEIRLGDVPWGYSWIIPRSGWLNIGVGSFQPSAFPLKQRFLALAASVAGSRTVSPKGHPLPYRWHYVSPMTGHTLFVGDAAGYMDAFSAEGIYSALLTATLASECIIRHITRGDPLTAYARRFRQEVWPPLRAAARMSILFYPRALFWARHFGQDPRLIRDYLDIARGYGSYQALQQHTARTLLHHWFKS
ncbi:MAG: geranylgeranyl reductase family protein [Firmicutes bacterium]|nr:geranylgeranyl reductase family protein [Bacillota bacterium]